MARTPYWEDTLIEDTLAAATQNEQSLVGGLSEDERRGMTVVRTLVHFWLTPNVTSGVVGTMTLLAGIGVANDQAFGVGSTALPQLTINSERPLRGWLWKDSLAIVDDATTVAPVTELKVDIRSKRKVDAGILYLATEGDTRSGTAFVIKVSGLIRVLYLMA